LLGPPLASTFAALGSLRDLLEYEENVSSWAQLTEYCSGLASARSMVVSALAEFDDRSPVLVVESLINNLRQERRLSMAPAKAEYSTGIAYALDRARPILAAVET
jgi:hypothetical protein